MKHFFLYYKFNMKNLVIYVVERIEIVFTVL